MPSSKKVQQAREVLNADQREAAKFATEAGARDVRKLLERAARDLERRLRQVEGLKGPGQNSFTATQLRATLSQVRQAQRGLHAGIQRVTLRHGDRAAQRGAENTVDYLRRADEAFRGVGEQPLPLKLARMLSAASQGSEASILRRLAGDPDHPAQPGILERYGTATVGEFEKRLQRGLVARKSWAEMREDITAESPFLQGAPSYWAARIVRTEVMGAQNRGQWEAIRELDDDVGDAVKILSATFDDRTAADSYAVHGQIRRPEEPFETWYGLMQHPPARPNDREVVTPHRVAWPIPPYLAWRDPAETAARWKAEGHKQRMPPIPEMTTVPLASFGKRSGAVEGGVSRGRPVDAVEKGGE